MLALPTLLLLSYLELGQCSLVVDSISQKGIYLSDYCPKMKYCPEGSHVMCMYYNPDRLMGPRCNKPKNVSITSDLAEKLLEISNAVRSKIALGKEKGKDGNLLPKGYGMHKLKWDNELATFAQVLANQCVLRHDLCRATKRFPDPGQTAGLVRFTYPEWFPMSKSAGMETHGLTKGKLVYAITQSLKSWYGQKEAVNETMLLSYPDWAKHPTDQHGRLYMEMIYGPATHMGCGISAYTDYAYYDNKAALNYNSVQVICNFSKRARKGTAVYEVNPPTAVGYTIKCGCPEGFDEDNECLCYESKRNAIRQETSCASPDHSCKPSVVLLPIFTVENAPPEKLALRSGFENHRESEMEIMDLYGPDNNTVLHPQALINQPGYTVLNNQPNIHNVLSNIINEPRSGITRSFQGNYAIPGSYAGNNIFDHKQEPPMFSQRITSDAMLKNQAQGPHSVITNLLNEVHPEVSYPLSASIKPRIIDVKNRFFDKKTPQQLGYHGSGRASLGLGKNKKESMFTKVATFELPKKGEKLIKDVLPRKDFSKAKSLVKTYLNLRRHQSELKANKKSSIDFLKLLNGHTTSATETYLNSAEEKVLSYNNYHSKNKFEPNSNRSNKDIYSDYDNSKEKSHDHIMNLLNKLEQEVKHIQLDKSKKELFDAKLRKIYGSVVGKVNHVSPKTDTDSDFELSDLENDHIGFSEIEKIREQISQRRKLAETVMNKHETNKDIDKRDDSQNEIRPIARNQNDIIDIFRDKEPRGIKTDYDTEIKHPFGEKSKFNYNDFNRDEKSRILYNDKDNVRSRHLYVDAEEKKRIKDAEKRKSHLSLSDHEDDPLSADRRRFYQEKLDNIERKLHSARKYQVNENPIIRPVIRPSRAEQSLRSSKPQVDQFYVPDRARFLHGF